MNISLDIRGANTGDLPALARIQALSPEAAQWDVAGYLTYDCLVLQRDRQVAAFLAARETAPGERELLNLAVEPAQRRHGLARKLLENALKHWPGVWFLEVRESNSAALRLYESLGFEPYGRREKYYRDPAESGIVMKIVS